MTDRELMQQALEALQKIYIAPEHEEYIRVWWPACEDAIIALRERLAQPEQEPMIDESAANRIATALRWEPKREWIGLTEKERMEILRDYNENPDQYSYGDPMICFGRAFEDKLKEKNT